MGNYSQISGGAKLATTALSLFGPNVNYDKLKIMERQKELEAKNQLNQLRANLNMMRENFIASVGSYKAQQARRGVKVSDAGATQNIERSAKAFGTDVETATGNAEFRASMISAQADMYNSAAHTQAKVNMFERLGQLSYDLDDTIDTFKKKGISDEQMSNIMMDIP